ncbi:MAG: carboxymuconolactone decarboxylase family protein [Actinobacteria bacterium]|nr:carboxymuconolactone decarboxylase family protein [Actinomycetota bacterium]MBU1945112.1 carboxymuconolactone decarboxylase family protein [Actinomycetota bacterium]MBU2686437.1 carboxymuconolactone decarboxylase family protein [Actinomycetota bacterium]
MAEDLYEKGMAEMRRHFGKDADAHIERLRRISPEFARVNVEFPFGELYTRNVLDDKTRELCTIAALTVEGHCLPELKIHAAGALNCGATREEVIEVIIQMIAYCGFPAATNALIVVNEAFEELDR